MISNGFVALIGRPNAGKSSLMNALIGETITITSNKPNTTRRNIRGIYNDERSQIIFLDTPGLNQGDKSAIDQFLTKNTLSTLAEVDIILFLHAANEHIGAGDRAIAELIAKEYQEVPRLALITKIDLVSHDEVIRQVAQLKALGFNEVMASSIKDKLSQMALIYHLSEKLPRVKTPFYDKEDLTDASMAFIAMEFVRESALNFLHEEIPHAIGVRVKHFIGAKDANDMTSIAVDIIVEKESQKGIVIGKNGTMIKKIGIVAKNKIGKLVATKIRLDLEVFVIKNWTRDPEWIAKLS